jgi:hypothetical protein
MIRSILTHTAVRLDRARPQRLRILQPVTHSRGGQA